VMTSNLGAHEMDDLMTGGLGFGNTRRAGQADAALDDKITRTAQDAARRKFSPEFMNRIDKIVVFKTLKAEHLEQILEIELGMVQQRILQATGNSQFVFSCTAPVKGFLLEEGTDPKYGARHLKRAIEKNVVFPLANLVATAQIKLGDFIRIDRKESQFTFTKEAEGALVPVLLEKYGDLNSGSPLAAKAGRGTSKGRDLGGVASILDPHK
jgi:ATP-dependent Clp protease ATP-binding subunit ClpB